jgi:hypothetical protein
MNDLLTLAVAAPGGLNRCKGSALSTDFTIPFLDTDPLPRGGGTSALAGGMIVVLA